MSWSALTNWWRGRDETIAEAQWDAAIAALPLLQGLDATERGRLCELASTFLRKKTLEPVGGLQLTTQMRLELALQACLPILELGLEYYRNWYSVVIYPAGFVAEHEYVAEDGTVHIAHGELAGEAWEQGPVILSWDDICSGTELDGFNVIIHEFAHKLDMLQGSVNGLPPLHRNMSAAAWSEAFSRAYEDFCARVDAETETLPIDDYAAESPAEFFAVLSEAFFELPDTLHRLYPEVYWQLALFYRQDPHSRLSRA